jgi:ABC-2 type transport system ATP-binding protein
MNPVLAPTATRTSTQVVASLDAVTKRYQNDVLALDDLSLSLRAGEVLGLLGPNGAGKSTAVRLLMGLSAPTSGRVSIFGRDPRLAANRLRTGVMLQVGRAPENLKVREHIDIFRGYYPQPMSPAELIRAAGLQGLENRLFGQLSGGQKQRVLFALALAGDPDLIFLDEPTVGLDIEARRGMWTQIRALAERGKTILLTTHYLEEADALANRIAVIAKGRLICEGTPAEVKALGASKVLGAEAGSNSDVPRPMAASGVRIIRCVTALSAEELLRMPGVSQAESSNSRAVITSSAPEATLREMLAMDAHLNSLEVQSPALEDAFLALTSVN